MNRILRVPIGGLILLALLAFSKPASATIISGFESTVSWTASASTPLQIRGGTPPYSPIEGTAYLSCVTYSSTTFSLTPPGPVLTLPETNYVNPVPLVTGNNSGSGNFLSLCYATTNGVASSFKLGLVLFDGANSFTMYTENLIPTTSTSLPSGWNMLVVSLNYLTNLGLNVAGLNSGSGQIQIVPGLSAPVTTLNISYDRLAVDEGATSTPNWPTSGPGVSASCGNQVTLSMPGSWGIGTHPAEGFHIYRAPVSGGVVSGPYAAVGYVTTTTGAFIDNNVIGGNSYSYITLPYDTVAPNVPTSGVFLLCQQDGGLSYSTGLTGPNEALLSDNLGTATQVTANAPAAIPTPGVVASNGCATQINLIWGAVTLPAGSCNSIVLYRVQRATDPDTTFAAPVTQPTGTNSYVDTAVVANATYWYRVWAVDSLGREGASGTPFTVKADAANACGWPVAPTATPTSTPTSVPTAVPVPGKAQIYPNPFHPDRGECFRVGAVAAGTQMKIYDMVGALVYSRTLGGTTACVDNWDGNNNNGQKVVTGLYQVLLTFTDGTNTIYRVAVIRGN